MRFIYPDFEWNYEPTRRERREMARRQQAIRDARREHIQALMPLLPPSLQVLQELRIDDAVTRRVVKDDVRRQLYLLLSHSNEEYGRFDLHLRFRDITLSRRDWQTLQLIARQGLQSDVKSWEVDLVPDVGPQPYIYRLQWHTQLQMWQENEQGKLPVTRRSHRPATRRLSRSARVTIMLTPEIELRFAALDLEIIPTQPVPWRRYRYVPEGRRACRLWQEERRERRRG